MLYSLEHMIWVYNLKFLFFILITKVRLLLPRAPCHFNTGVAILLVSGANKCNSYNGKQVKAFQISLHVRGE